MPTDTRSGQLNTGAKMKTYMTEDGYKFFLLEDGRLVDNLDPELCDMSFDSFEEFMEATEHSATEIKQ
jgi:glutamate synthase domain-containing protein 1